MSTPDSCRFSPSHPLGYAEMLIRRRIDRALARSGNAPHDLGASVIEWVIISALLVGIAVAVGTILLNTITAKATSINLDTGTP